VDWCNNKGMAGVAMILDVESLQTQLTQQVLGGMMNNQRKCSRIEPAHSESDSKEFLPLFRLRKKHYATGFIMSVQKFAVMKQVLKSPTRNRVY